MIPPIPPAVLGVPAALALAAIASSLAPARARGHPPPLPGQVQPAPPDRSAFTLFNPTPRGLRRPMSTDRPDATESPFTVDAGAVQVELSFVEFSHDDRDAPRTRTLAVAPLNFKVGLVDNADLQLLLEPYLRIEEAGAPPAEGPGDLGLRLKVNLWGNDAGDTALAVMPFISLPTGDDDVSAGAVEGGLSLPFAASLPGGFSLGLMLQLDLLRADDGRGTDALLVHTATIGRDLFGPVAGFLELVGVAPLESGAGGYRALLSAGLTWAATGDLAFDAGLRVGLTGPDTEDLAVFAGMSLRF